jgi:hypothetical protein
MSEPTFENAFSNLQKHLRLLINQPIVEFQEKHGVKIRDVDIDLIDVSNVEGKKQVLVSKVIIKIENK